MESDDLNSASLPPGTRSVMDWVEGACRSMRGPRPSAHLHGRCFSFLPDWPEPWTPPMRLEASTGT